MKKWGETDQGGKHFAKISKWIKFCLRGKSENKLKGFLRQLHNRRRFKEINCKNGVRNRRNLKGMDVIVTDDLLDLIKEQSFIICGSDNEI